jgi:hypothetical protein
MEAYVVSIIITVLQYHPRGCVMRKEGAKWSRMTKIIPPLFYGSSKV